MYKRLHVKYPLFLSDLMKLESPGQILEKSSNKKCHENPSGGSRVFHADGQTDGGTDGRK